SEKYSIATLCCGLDEGEVLMKVILKKDIDKLGAIGTMVNVKEGYARNYLFPKKYAVCADAKNIKQLEHQKRIEAKIKSKFKRECGDLALRIEKASCTLVRKSGENERLFGSVTAMDIAENLKEQGIDIDRKKIVLESPIKSVGVFTVPIKIHSEITANLKVWVMKENEQDETEEGEKEPEEEQKVKE
ncbi:MAG: 50S ribosomal protein L9, partial [bacterium]